MSLIQSQMTFRTPGGKWVSELVTLSLVGSSILSSFPEVIREAQPAMAQNLFLLMLPAIFLVANLRQGNCRNTFGFDRERSLKNVQWANGIKSQRRLVNGTGRE